ncbi:MAG: hypothetical protein ABI668_12685 [Sphingorhabdus sp.]
MSLADAPIRLTLQTTQQGSVVYLTTNSSFRFHVRSAHPRDEATLTDFSRMLPPEDLRFRFLSGLRKVGHDHLAEMTRDDDPTKISFLAMSADDGTMVAPGCWQQNRTVRLPKLRSQFAPI